MSWDYWRSISTGSYGGINPAIKKRGPKQPIGFAPPKPKPKPKPKPPAARKKT